MFVLSYNMEVRYSYQGPNSHTTILVSWVNRLLKKSNLVIFILQNGSSLKQYLDGTQSVSYVSYKSVLSAELNKNNSNIYFRKRKEGNVLFNNAFNTLYLWHQMISVMFTY